MLKKIVIISLLFFLLSIGIVHAVDVSVTPSRISITAKPGQLTKESLEIKNPSGLVSIYDIYVDDYSDWLKITPKSFTLEAGETKKISLEIRPVQTGVFATQISVVAKPLSSREFQANSGIKIPLEIKVIPAINAKKNLLTPTNLLYFANLLLIIILAISLIKKMKIKNKKP